MICVFNCRLVADSLGAVLHTPAPPQGLWPMTYEEVAETVTYTFKSIFALVSGE